MNAGAALLLAREHVGTPAVLVCRPNGRVHVHVGRLTPTGAVPRSQSPLCGQRSRRLTALHTDRLAPVGGGPARTLCRRCTNRLARFAGPVRPVRIFADPERLPDTAEVIVISALMIDSTDPVQAHAEYHAVNTALLRCGRYAQVRKIGALGHTVGELVAAARETYPDVACCPPPREPKQQLVRLNGAWREVEFTKHGVIDRAAEHRAAVEDDRAMRRNLGIPRGRR